MMILLLLFGLSAPVQDTPSATIRKAVPFLITVDQLAEADPLDAVTQFRLYIDGAVKQTQTASEAGCNSFPCSPSFLVASGLPKGTYTLYIEAINPEGVSASQAIRLFVTAGPPQVPTGIRISVVIKPELRP